MRKYGFDDARPVLERSSARETASRVALGEVAKQFLEQTLGIRTVSHVLSIGGAGITDPQNAVLPKPEDLEALDASPVRTLDKTAEPQMIARIDEAKENADTLGGVIEVVVYGVPAGIGTYVESDRRLDAALASAVMGVQAIKGVEIGDGFLEALRPGSQAHDEMVVGDDGRITRLSNRAGGIEGGMSNGQPIVVRAAMKPIPSIPKALRTVDVTTGESAQAINQRSDNTAVPAAAVVAEAMVRLTIARSTRWRSSVATALLKPAQRRIRLWPEHAPKYMRCAEPSATVPPMSRGFVDYDVRPRAVIIGMMGAGKTRVGKEAAHMMRLPFADADNEIEHDAGMKIPEYFEKVRRTGSSASWKPTSCRHAGGFRRHLLPGRGRSNDPVHPAGARRIHRPTAARSCI